MPQVDWILQKSYWWCVSQWARQCPILQIMDDPQEDYKEIHTPSQTTQYCSWPCSFEALKALSLRRGLGLGRLGVLLPKTLEVRLTQNREVEIKITEIDGLIVCVCLMKIISIVFFDDSEREIVFPWKWSGDTEILPHLLDAHAMYWYVLRNISFISLTLDWFQTCMSYRCWCGSFTLVLWDELLCHWIWISIKPLN